MVNQKKKQNKKLQKKHYKTYKIKLNAEKELGLDIPKENKRTIPIFIPHFGCKNECVFCNQRRISGRQVPVYPNDVKNQIDDALSKYTHDEKNVAKVGDTVRIRATRPLSKTKRYELVEVLVEAVVLQEVILW